MDAEDLFEGGNDNNLECYLNEAFHDNVDAEDLLEDSETSLENSEAITLEKGQSFDDFDHAEKHIQDYAKYMGFKVAKSEKSGKTVRQGCKWHINLSRPTKNNPNSRVFVTTFVNEHNHKMCSEALQFEKLKAFTNQMKEDIEFYIKECHFEIQRHKPSAGYNKADTARLYEELQAKKHEDPRWFVELKFGDLIGHNNTAGTNRYHMPLSLFVITDDNMKSRIIAQALLNDKTKESYQWVLHMTKKATRGRIPNENIKKVLHEKLDGSFSDFYFYFWKYRNADTPDVFNHYWNEMINNYLTACTYLQNQLYDRCRLWARVFTTTLFTLGIESTSFVESQNAGLKRIIESSNMSLYELGKVLIDSAEDNIKQKQYKDLIRGVSLKVNITTIFPQIELLISYYLHPKVIWFLVDQMKKSVFYLSFRFSIKEIQNMSVNEPSESDNFEDEPDRDHEFVEIVKTYLASIHEKETRSQQANNSENEDSDKENNTLPNIVLRNQRKVATRGRPKLSSHRNQQSQRSASESLNDKRKRGQNQCSYCKELGHNIATCSKKVKDQQL
ncbi:hypothetical protein C2G38_2172475 [Gigaspora rosea]|uniref:Uncharacterized protein n=1 Tax=Gigaspora rosea TaxID=44941 RepID=A0A397VVG3_9GLOM|nr:hypothetical protein C2G38_2172475 [Gigaspora rosea]